MRAHAAFYDLWTVGVGPIKDVHAAEVVVAFGYCRIIDGAEGVLDIIPSTRTLAIFEDRFGGDVCNEEPIT